jgi:hypothetical protein
VAPDGKYLAEPKRCLFFEKKKSKFFEKSGLKFFEKFEKNYHYWLEWSERASEASDAINLLYSGQI